MVPREQSCGTCGHHLLSAHLAISHAEELQKAVEMSEMKSRLLSYTRSIKTSIGRYAKAAYIVNVFTLFIPGSLYGFLVLVSRIKAVVTQKPEHISS